jgi:hypothetical protein
MPVQYGQYNLANSRQVRPFEGSVLPELTVVSSALQERYDKALDQDDMISRAVRSVQAAPFAQDQQLLSSLKQEFRDRLQQRATRGDYENMYRDTMMDSRNFMDRYQPIAENAKRFEDYKGTLQQALAKGDIKDPDKMRRLLALSTQSYQGMSYDPVTGQYANKFQGLTPVKDIDPTEKIDKWMKDVAPTVLGTKTRFSDGVWMQEKEGKWVTLGPREIQTVITAGRRLDPEFNAWMDQERLLSTTDVNNLTPEAIQQMKDGPVKQAILTDMQNNGSSPIQAAKNVVAGMREQGIYQSMQQYANKYIRDDREIASGPTGADPYNLQRTGKKLEDEVISLSMPILQPEARATINGAEDLLTKVKDAGAAVQAARQNFDSWVVKNQIRPDGKGNSDGKGNWIDANGNDKTLKYLEQKQVYKQTEKAWQDLQKLDAEARKRTGYNPGKSITPELLKRAEQAGQAAIDRMAGEILADGEAETIRQGAKSKYLRENAPGYDSYDTIIKGMTEQGAQEVSAQTFTSDAANKQATNLFKGLVLNLDAKGLKAGPVGLKWAMGPKAGEDLSADDYKKVAADAVFAGYAMDTDGQLKYYYNVGKVTQNAKGELVGSQSVVKMPALPGTAEILIKTKQMDPMQMALGQQINQTINNPSGQGYINVDGTNKIFVDRIDKTEIGNEEVGAGLNLRFPAPGGTYTEMRVTSVGEAINTITQVLQRNMQRKQNK